MNKEIIDEVLAIQRDPIKRFICDSPYRAGFQLREAVRPVVEQMVRSYPAGLYESLPDECQVEVGLLLTARQYRALIAALAKADATDEESQQMIRWMIAERESEDQTE